MSKERARLITDAGSSQSYAVSIPRSDNTDADIGRVVFKKVVGVWTARVHPNGRKPVSIVTCEAPSKEEALRLWSHAMAPVGGDVKAENIETVKKSMDDCVNLYAELMTHAREYRDILRRPEGNLLHDATILELMGIAQVVEAKSRTIQQVLEIIIKHGNDLAEGMREMSEKLGNAAGYAEGAEKLLNINNHTPVKGETHDDETDDNQSE